MLTERALQIFDKLIECNGMPVTSKMLALHLGVSERSVKNYIKEVIDYCNKTNMELISKPGKGFVANFTSAQIAYIDELHKDNKTVLTQKNRIAYIVYILLSGWDSYTLSLFSEELNVSKKVISDDLDELAKELRKYDMSIRRVAGQGISIVSDEFSTRRALREFCVFPIGNREVIKSDDYRLTINDESICINNFGIENFNMAFNTVKHIEGKYKISYTDYSFKMLVHYLCIGLSRISSGKGLSYSIKEDDFVHCPEIIAEVKEFCLENYGISLSKYELEYVDVLFACGQLQDKKDILTTMVSYKNNYNEICDDIMEYFSEILGKNFLQNELLRKSMGEFIPASFMRTKYGIMIINPFLSDVKEMYAGIFATCFSVTGFYEKYCNANPTEHEISFVALYIGGAIVRNTVDVKAVLIGTGGMAAANIVARKIENLIDEIKVVAILSSDDELENYDYDILLSMHHGRNYEGKYVEISPIISEKDIKKIKSLCYDIATGNGMDNKREELSKLIDRKCIRIVTEKISKEELLREVCDYLYEMGHVAENFYDDVMNRENIGMTAIGNGIAIPHGMTANVCKPIVYVVKSEEGVDWGNEQVDLIFVLALNFDNVTTTKAFFSDFSKLIESKEKMNAIREAKTIDDIEELLKNKIYWRE